MKVSKQYLAGFIDGEGYLGIIKKSDNRKRSIKTGSTLGYYYTPVLKIFQVTKNDEVLFAIKEFIGYGCMSINKLNTSKLNAKNSNSNNKTSIELRGMKRVFPVIKKLFPYLIVKKKQAEVLIKYSKLSTVGIGHQRDKLRKIVDKQRTDLYEQIKFLNKRGLAETKR